MKNILDILKEHNLIDDNNYNDIKKMNNSIKENRENLINILIENNKLKHSIYKQEREDEQEIIKQIQDIISSSIFKRAYTNTKFHENINDILDKLESDNIKICQSYHILTEILRELQNSIDNQTDLEEKEIKLIENNIGKSMWKEYREFFNTDEFLEVMNICRDL